MAFDSIYLLYGAIFLAALLLIEGIYYLIADSRAGREAANRRMQMLAAGASNREIFDTLRRKPRENTSKFGIFGGWAAKLDKVIQRAGLTVPTSRIFLLMAALSVTTFLVIVTITRGTLIFNNPVLSLPLIAISISIGIGAPLLYLQYIRSKRMNLFAEQLPDALDVMVRSLHAGHPISAAMALVTKEMPDPIGTEFGIAIDEMTYGLDMRDALANLGDRVDVEDFQYVVVSINIQHETGGNLAEVLHGLSTVIRARFTMFKKIRALSAEGRLSAKILAVMPFVFGGFVLSSKPDVYLEVAEDPLFFPFLGVAFVLEVIGIYIMYKLVNFRV